MMRGTRLVGRGHPNVWDRTEELPGPEGSGLRALAYRRPNGSRRVDIELAGPRGWSVLHRVEATRADEPSIAELVENARWWTAGYAAAVERRFVRRGS